MQSDRFTRFLDEYSLSLVRLERVNAQRNRVVVESGGKTLSVSFNAARPTRCAVKKLSHHLREEVAA